MIIEKIDYNEALSYLGYHGEAPDENTLFSLERFEEQLLKVITPRYVYKIFDKNSLPILIGNDIAMHLTDSDSAAVMAVTIGVGADNLQRAAQVNNMAGAVILDALMTVAVEMLCDAVENEIAKCSAVSKEMLTTRFSPGYGDFPLEVQTDLLKLIDAEKRTGIFLNESGMMIPLKSVTAVIGIRNWKGQL